MSKEYEVNRLYNSRVRQAMSEEYVKCSKKRADIEKEREKNHMKLLEGKNTMTYSDYMQLQKDTEKLGITLERLSAEFDTWDKAREICLNVADELKEMDNESKDE